MKSGNNRAAIYARFSDAKQKTNLSIEAQLAACYECAENKGINVVREYVDRAKSGRTIKNRKGLHACLEDSKDKFDYLIVYAVDRLSRDNFDYYNIKQELKYNGVELITTQSDNDTNTAIGELQESIVVSFASYERKRLRERTILGTRQLIQAGYYPQRKPRSGYNIIEEKYAGKMRKKLVVCPEKSQFVRYIFGNYRHGIFSFSCMAYNCNFKFDTNFSSQDIKRIIQNPVYKGCLVLDGEEIEGTHEAIVNNEVWDECQGLNPNRYMLKKKYKLKGKIYCGCGSTMSGASAYSSNNKKKYTYYKCFKRIKNKEACKQKSIRSEVLEPHIIKKVSKEIKENMVDAVMLELIEDDKDGVFYKYEELKKRKAGITQAIAANPNTNLDTLLRELTTIQQTIDVIESPIDQTLEKYKKKVRKEAISVINDFLDIEQNIYDSIKKVVVDGDNIEISVE